jgi:hypothetical protein
VEKQLIAVEKWTFLLAAMAVAVALLALERKAAFSLAIGAALAAGNAWALHKIGQRIAGLQYVIRARPGLAILLFNLKMAVYATLVWLAVHFLHLDAVPFLIGISVLPVAIAIAALRQALYPHGPHEDNHG